jgi:protein TonB
MTEFEDLLDGVLREMAEVEMREGFAMRMMTAFESDVVGIVPRVEARPVVLGRSFGLLGRTERGFGPFGWALVAHAAVLLIVGFAMASQQVRMTAAKLTLIDELVAPPPLKMQPKALTAGGGGGQVGPTPVAQGHLPKFAETQIVLPKAPPMEQPKIAVEPTVVMQKDLKMADSTLPNLGMPNSPIVGAGSLGNGRGTGMGSGDGGGVGAGSGGNTGGGAYRIGGGVSAPVPISMPDPEFSEEARKAKMSGNVLVYLWVDPTGKPSHVRVIRGIGMGLDEKALEAVKQYRFKPAKKDGVPVAVEMNVEVGFQIF